MKLKFTRFTPLTEYERKFLKDSGFKENDGVWTVPRSHKIVDMKLVKWGKPTEELKKLAFPVTPLDWLLQDAMEEVLDD